MPFCSGAGDDVDPFALSDLFSICRSVVKQFCKPIFSASIPYSQTTGALIGFEDVASILTIKLLVETLAHVVAASCIAYWVCQFHYALSYSKR